MKFKNIDLSKHVLFFGEFNVLLTQTLQFRRSKRLYKLKFRFTYFFFSSYLFLATQETNTMGIMHRM